MKHLDIDRIISTLDGTATDPERSHLEGCVQCQKDLETWRRRLDGLRDIVSNSLTEGELHNLRAMFRHYGPTAEQQSWLARLVRRSEPTPVAVAARGSLSTTFEEYQAGPWSLVIQIRPTGATDLYDVHGQLTGAEVQGGELLLTSDLGFGECSQLDSFGEFHLPGVPAGAYDATWLVGGTRIELRNLDIGDTDDRSGV